MAEITRFVLLRAHSTGERHRLTFQRGTIRCYVLRDHRYHRLYDTKIVEIDWPEYAGQLLVENWHGSVWIDRYGGPFSLSVAYGLLMPSVRTS